LLVDKARVDPCDQIGFVKKLNKIINKGEKTANYPA
jgi:hypothetical protein